MRTTRQRNANASTRNADFRRENSVLFVEDVMEILGIGHSKAYAIMRQINMELEAEGYITIGGRVSEARFREKFYTGKTQVDPENTGKTAKAR